MTPDYSEAIRFLRWLYPNGPWLLTAIPFNRIAPFPTTRTSDTKEVLLWLMANEQHNLYYSVNEPLEHVTDKKASKTDIARVHFLHIDMDVRKADECEEEAQARILATLDRYPRRPSALVSSGGGFNALWRLTSPITLDTESESKRDASTEDIEGRNKQIAADLEGDVTHDLSRILRLPGTINRLNKVKVERGRVPSLSRIIWLEDSTYDVSAFLNAPTAPKNQTTSSARVDTHVARTEDVDQLHITDRLKVIISQGHDPEDPITDRSSVVWFVCCELVRLAFKDEVILGIITDTRYRISDHVFAQGSRWMQYAIRQIRRAKEKAFDPKLLEMNDKYAVIRDYGGKCVVMKEGEKGEKMTFQRPAEFFYGHDNEKIVWKSLKDPDKTVIHGVGTWWFDQRMRRQYERVVFEPGVETPGALNLWQGFAVEPRPGNAHARYLENMFENICAGHDDRYQYLLRWMARVVQRPNTQAMVCPVLLGDRGTGKSVFGKGFARIFGIGTHAFVAKDAREVTGRFNEHLRSVVFLLAEEAFDIRDKSHESSLKELITSDILATEGKGYAILQTKNYVHPMLTSNEERVVPAGDMERRYLVMRVKEKTHSDAWFRSIDEDDQRDGSLSHLLYHLLSIDLTDFNVTSFPQTEELRTQQAHNLSREDDWLWSKLEAGVWLSTMRVRWTGPVIKEILYREYLQVMMSLNVGRPMSLRQFGMWIKRSLPDVRDKQLAPMKDRSRPWAFEFPPLSTCRAYFAQKRGQKGYEWPPMADEDEGEVVYDSGQGVFE